MADDKRPEGAMATFVRDGSIVLASLTAVLYGIVALYQSGLFSFFNLPYDLNRPDLRAVFNVLGDLFIAATMNGTWLVTVALLIPLIIIASPRITSRALLRRYWLAYTACCGLGFLLTPLVSAPWHLLFVVPIVCAISRRRQPKDEWTFNQAHAVFRAVLIALLLVPDAYFFGFHRYQVSADLHVASTGASQTPIRTVVVAIVGDILIGVKLSRVGRSCEWRPSGEVTLTKLKPGETYSLTPCTAAYPQPINLYSRLARYFFVYDHERSLHLKLTCRAL